MPFRFPKLTALQYVYKHFNLIRALSEQRAHFKRLSAIKTHYEFKTCTVQERYHEVQCPDAFPEHGD